jgi:hypothetical protein
MPNTRITERDHAILQAISAQTGKPHSEIIHEALDTYQRKSLLDRANAGYARLRENKVEWNAELAERKLWEATLPDGLDDD